jgi:hypothetical protein
MASLAFAHALVEEGHGRVRLLLVQAHALRPPHLGGELIVHGCCLMSGWVQGRVALARPVPLGGGTIVKDPAGIGLGHGLTGLSLPIRSMPRAPSMLLVKHMDRGGRGGRLGLVLMSRPCRRIGAAAVLINCSCLCKLFFVGDTGPRKGSSLIFLGVFVVSNSYLRWRDPNRDFPEKPEGF